MDEGKIDNKHLTPIQTYLNSVDSISSLSDFLHTVGKLHRHGLANGALLQWDIMPTFPIPDVSLVHLIPLGVSAVYTGLEEDTPETLFGLVSQDVFDALGVDPMEVVHVENFFLQSAVNPLFDTLLNEGFEALLAGSKIVEGDESSSSLHVDMRPYIKGFYGKADVDHEKMSFVFPSDFGKNLTEFFSSPANLAASKSYLKWHIAYSNLLLLPYQFREAYYAIAEVFESASPDSLYKIRNAFGEFDNGMPHFKTQTQIQSGHFRRSKRNLWKKHIEYNRLHALSEPHEEEERENLERKINTVSEKLRKLHSLQVKANKAVFLKQKKKTSLSSLSHMYQGGKSSLASSSGMSTQEDAQERGVQCFTVVAPYFINNLIKAWVQREFPESNKPLATKLVNSILVAMEVRLNSTSWLDEDTHTAALEKVRGIVANVAFDSPFDTYGVEDLSLSKGEAFGNFLKLKEWLVALRLRGNNKPPRRDLFADYGMPSPILDQVLFPSFPFLLGLPLSLFLFPCLSLFDVSLVCVWPSALSLCLTYSILFLPFALTLPLSLCFSLFSFSRSSFHSTPECLL